MDLEGQELRGPPRKGPPDPTDHDLKSGIQWSIIVHSAILTFVILKSLVFPSTPEVYIPTLRVDLVALPDQLKKDKTNLAKAPMSDRMAEALQKAENAARKIKPIERPTTPDEMILNPKEGGTAKNRKKKLKNALDRIKSLAKIQSEEEGPAAPQVKGNRLSKGSSLSADAKESNEPNYLDSVRDRLKDNWALPIWLSRQNLSAQVQIFIDSKGLIRSYRFSKSSGNAQFDDAIRTTLKDSQPLPPPPKSVAGGLLSQGVVLGFPL